MEPIRKNQYVTSLMQITNVKARYKMQTQSQLCNITFIVRQVKIRHLCKVPLCKQM